MAEKTPDELAAEKEAQDKLNESRERANEAKERQLQLDKDLNEQGGLNRAQLEEISGALRDQLNSYQNINTLTDQYRSIIQSQVTAEKELAKAKGEGNTVLAGQLELQLKQIEVSKADVLAKSKLADANEKVDESIVGVGDNVIRFNRIALEQDERLAELRLKIARVTDSSYAAGLALNSFGSILSTAGMETANFSAGGFQMAKQITDIGMKFDAASKAVQINTGLGQESVTQMKSLVSENYSLGVTTEQAAKAIGALNTEYSGFIGLNSAAREAAAETVVTLERLGVAAEVSGKAFDILDRGMGLGSEGARAAVEDLDTLAQSLGLPTAQVANDFTKLGPKLARFGKQGKKQFDLLSEQARSLGISVEAAFEIGEAFDTFEGAADMAGKLNAQLGLQINSVAMLGATHEERIKMLRQEFAVSGQNFDQLHHRQRQAIAEMMGVDVDVAGKLFGDPIKYQQYIKDQEDARERAERLTAAQDKLAAVADRLLVAFGPVFSIIAGIASLLAMGPIPHLIALLTGLIGVYVTYQKIRMALLTTEQLGLVMTKRETAALMARNAIQKIKNLLGFAASVQEDKDIAKTPAKVSSDIAKSQSEDKLTQSKIRGAGATTLTGAAAMSAALQMAAFGAAVLMVGGGIYLAATGMSNFVAAFAELSVDQMIGASLAMVTMAAGFGALATALPGLALSAVLSTGPLLALGGALLMIGAGIGLIGAGASMAFESIAKVIEVSTTVSDSDMENVSKLMDRMIEVQTAGQFANVPALNAIAGAVNPNAAGGAQRGNNKTIELKVNERILGDVVVDIMNNRFDLTPR